MCKNHVTPVHCIIPPYMLNKLMESDNKKIADLAINTNFRSYRFRSDRLFFHSASLYEKTILGKRFYRWRCTTAIRRQILLQPL